MGALIEGLGGKSLCKNTATVRRGWIGGGIRNERECSKRYTKLFNEYWKELYELIVSYSNNSCYINIFSIKYRRSIVIPHLMRDPEILQYTLDSGSSPE